MANGRDGEDKTERKGELPVAKRGRCLLLLSLGCVV